MSQKVLSYDLGGTKIAAGIVSGRGKVLEEIRVPIHLGQGKKGVLHQLETLGSQLLSRHPQIQKVGIASAGPLDPEKGELLEPTNFSRNGHLWGKVPLTQLLSKKLKRRVYLENDAAAAALAEHWVGAGKNYQNMIVLTLGTGLGTGIICNGHLVRSGRHLHPEAGHMIIQVNDESAPCGCGNLGCAEAYLSGGNFEKRIRRKYPHLGRTSKEIADQAREGNPQAMEAFDEYARLMAVALYNYVRIFSPEIVIFAGSFAAASDLFKLKTQTLLKKMLRQQNKVINLVPKLTVSTLQNNSGIIGGAYIALNRNIQSDSNQVVSNLTSHSNCR